MFDYQCTGRTILYCILFDMLSTGQNNTKFTVMPFLCALIDFALYKDMKQNFEDIKYFIYYFNKNNNYLNNYRLKRPTLYINKICNN
jgi:hypothetical protein